MYRCRTVPICPAVAPDVRCLVGLRIGRGFMADLRRQLGGVRGCAHLVELFGPLATTAIQTVHPLRQASAGHGEANRRRRSTAAMRWPPPARRWRNTGRDSIDRRIRGRQGRPWVAVAIARRARGPASMAPRNC